MSPPHRTFQPQPCGLGILQNENLPAKPLPMCHCGLTWLRPLLGSERQSLAIFNVHPTLPQPESPLLAQSHPTQFCCPTPQLPCVRAEVYTAGRHFRVCCHLLLHGCWSVPPPSTVAVLHLMSGMPDPLPALPQPYLSRVQFQGNLLSGTVWMPQMLPFSVPMMSLEALTLSCEGRSF